MPNKKQEPNTYEEEGKLIVSVEAPSNSLPFFCEDIFDGTHEGKKFHCAMSLAGNALYLMIEGEGLRCLTLRPVVEAWLHLAFSKQKVVTAELPYKPPRKKKEAKR